jgi:ribosomal protein S18 acetylase RimI-like enzyme
MELEKLSIRVMREDDLEEIIRIDAEYMGQRRDEYYKRLLKEILNPDFRIITSLVAEYDGKVIGFIVGTIFSGEFGVPENVAYITTIGIDKEFSRRGIGKELFEQFVTNARAAGVEKIYTIVEWDNWDLLRFFSRAGFKPSASLNLEADVK